MPSAAFTTSDGSFREVFNAPGPIAQDAVTDRVIPTTNLHSIQIGALMAHQASVAEAHKTSLRPTQVMQAHGIARTQD